MARSPDEIPRVGDRVMSVVRTGSGFSVVKGILTQKDYIPDQGTITCHVSVSGTTEENPTKDYLVDEDFVFISARPAEEAAAALVRPVDPKPEPASITPVI